MRKSSKDVITFLLVVGITLATAFVAVYVWASAKMGEETRRTLVRWDSRMISGYIQAWQGGDPNLGCLFASASNSTALLSALLPEMNHELHDWSPAVKGNNRTIVTITLSNNIWSVANKLPTNAPGQVVVVATRNLDARYLRTRMDKEDMSKQVPVNFEHEGLLSKYAMAIRKDGEWVVITRRGASSRQYASCGSLYGYKPFGLGVEYTNMTHMTYLTPDREVTLLDR